MHLSDFDFHLPDHLIAQTPAEERDGSRLLVVDRRTQRISHDVFRNIGKYLPERSTLVFNRSKVLNARLVLEEGQEIFLLKEVTTDTWECLVRPGKKFRVGTVQHKTLLSPEGHSCIVEVHIEEGPEGTRHLRFDRSVHELMEQYGHLPLPPYIAQERAKEFGRRYQTVYAQEQGSVAAPTAGLHFTEELLDELRAGGHETATVLLHVGLGTFQPVKVEALAEHHMHSEWFDLPPETATYLNTQKSAGSPIIAVGTTTTRVLESCGHQGVLTPRHGDTNIFIYPPHEFQFIDHLITNFHLPKSTLLMLVSAFGGIDLIKQAYKEAVEQEYRFYSFGDSMLII